MASTILRRLLLCLFAAGLLAVNAGSISTSGVKIVTYTQVLSGTTNTFAFPSANPCGGQPRTINLTSDGAFRITMLQSGPDKGYYWLSPTQRGTFEILPDQPDEPYYKGRFELQADAKSAHKGDITFFLHLVGTGSDGSPLDTRLLEHLAVSADRVTISMAEPAFLATPLACA